MKHYWLLLTLVLCSASALRAQDMLRLSERDITGTARFVGMGGAMTAVGGDPSAVVINNPAGLGVYRHFEAMLSFDVHADRTRQVGQGNVGTAKYFVPSQTSVNFHFDSPSSSLFSGHNLMISYSRLKSWNRVMYGTNTAVGPDASISKIMADNAKGLTQTDLNYSTCWDNEKVGWLTALGYWDSVINPVAVGSTDYESLVKTNETIKRNMYSEETGYFNQYSFNYAMNLSDRWYLGVGLNILSLQYRHFTQYREYYDINHLYYTDGGKMTLEQTLRMEGAGVNFALGFIGRPVEWLRIGASFQTPSTMRLTIKNEGTSYSDFVGSVNETPRNSYTYYHYAQPLKSSVGLGFHLGRFGLASLQYDYSYHKQINSLHSLRLGLEFVVIDQVYLNAGYVYESAMRDKDLIYTIAPNGVRTDTDFENIRYTHYGSCGIGYRGNYFMAHFAYQYRYRDIGWYAFENADVYNMKTWQHNFVFTFGFHM